MADSRYSSRKVPVASRGAGPPALHSERMLMVREARPDNNLRDYLSIFFKRRRMMIVTFVVLSILGCALALVYNKFIYTPRFEASSSILVKFGWENYYPDPSLGNRQRPAINQQEMLGAEMSILDSRDLKQKVISALTPEAISPKLTRTKFTGLSKQDEALLYLDKYLKVEAAPRGGVINVTFEGTNPQSAAAVVNQLVNDYIEKRAEIYKDPRSALFLQNKVDHYQKKLGESLNNMKAFSERTKIISFDEQRNMLLTRRANLDIALTDTANKINEDQQMIVELQKELKAIPRSELSAAASDRAGDAQSKLLGLKLKEQALTAKFKGNNPMIADVRAQIATVENYLKKSSASSSDLALADPVYQAIEKQILDNKAQLSALNVKYTDTQSQLSKVNDDIQSFEANEIQYRTLAAAVTSNRKIYGDYRQKLEEANAYNELGRDKMTSVSVIERAGVPIYPVNPPKPLPLLFAGAIVFALLCSLGIAYVREINKQVMSTAMEVEKKLDLPVLITVPIKD